MNNIFKDETKYEDLNKLKEYWYIKAYGRKTPHSETVKHFENVKNPFEPNDKDAIQIIDMFEFKNYIKMLTELNMEKQDDIMKFKYIYQTPDFEFKEFLDKNETIPRNFTIQSFRATPTKLLEHLASLVQTPLFYGLLFVKDKYPINILSYNFIYDKDIVGWFLSQKEIEYSVYSYPLNQSTVKGLEKEKTESTYTEILDNNVSLIEEIATSITSWKPAKMTTQINNIDTNIIGELQYNHFENDFDGAIHLSDFQTTIQVTKEDRNLNNSDFVKKYRELLILKPEDKYKIKLNLQGEAESSSEILTNGEWVGLLDKIDAGVVLPAYGIYKHNRNGSMSQWYGVGHPNIEKNGNNYCTGRINKYSEKGLSELQYGNLNSPMNTDIWSLETPAEVKGYQLGFMNHLFANDSINSLFK